MKKVGPGKEMGVRRAQLLSAHRGWSILFSPQWPFLKWGKLGWDYSWNASPHPATLCGLVAHLSMSDRPCTLLFYEGLHFQYYSFFQGSLTNNPAPKNQYRNARKCTHINFFDGSCQFASRSWKILKGSGWIWPLILSPAKHWNILFAELYTFQSTLSHCIFTGISS